LFNSGCAAVPYGREQERQQGSPCHPVHSQQPRQVQLQLHGGGDRGLDIFSAGRHVAVDAPVQVSITSILPAGVSATRSLAAAQLQLGGSATRSNLTSSSGKPVQILAGIWHTVYVPILRAVSIPTLPPSFAADPKLNVKLVVGIGLFDSTALQRRVVFVKHVIRNLAQAAEHWAVLWTAGTTSQQPQQHHPGEQSRFRHGSQHSAVSYMYLTCTASPMLYMEYMDSI